MTENKTKVSEELSKAGETSVITPLLLKLDTFNQDYIIRHPENPDCPWEWDFRKLFGRVMGGRSVMGYADFEETGNVVPLQCGRKFAGFNAAIEMSYLCNAEGNLRDLILALFTFKCSKCWI